MMSYLVGLIGAGIGPSLSPALHETEAAELGLRYVYRLIDLDERGRDVARVADLVAAAIDLGFDGLNITHPAKRVVLDGLDGLSADAEALGAVNTVVIRDGATTGHNTDWSGFAQSLQRGLPDATLDHVVVVGAGGAGSAVAYALCRLGAVRITIVDAVEAQATALAAALDRRFGPGRFDSVALARLVPTLAGADGLVHATPMGMAAHPGLAVPATVLVPSLWVADIVYRPLETELVRAARQVGCRVLDGGAMVVFQAADAFRLFTDVEPDPARMLENFSRLVDEEAGHGVVAQ
jgi:shikimate dehydrogenase